MVDRVGQAEEAKRAEEVPLLPLSYDRSRFLIKPWVKRYPLPALETTFWKDVVLEPH